MRRDDGFTLIELMIVITIIGILVVMAIPSFLNFRRNSQDRAAQSTLVNANKVVLAIGLEQGTMPSNAQLLATLPGLEAAYVWQDHLDPSTAPHEVSIDEDEDTEVALAVRSASGTCFYLRVDLLGPSVTHSDAAVANCVGHDFQDGAGAGW